MDLPLCIDLDGTLLKRDMTWHLTKGLAKKSWGSLICVLLSLRRGRAFFKQQLSQAMAEEIREIEIAESSYTTDFLAFLLQEKVRGRQLILATAADQGIAERVVLCLEKQVGHPLIELILASNGSCNLRAEAKARALIQHFGEGGFAYAGNSRDDFAVWKKAEKNQGVIVVNPSYKVLRRARLLYPQARYFGTLPS